MVLSLHNIASAYSVLPSEALSRGTTLDLEVLNLASKWEAHKVNERRVEKDPTAVTINNNSWANMNNEESLAALKRLEENANS